MLRYILFLHFRPDLRSNIWPNFRSNLWSNLRSNIWPNFRSNFRSNLCPNVGPDNPVRVHYSTRYVRCNQVVLLVTRDARAMIQIGRVLRVCFRTGKYRQTEYQFCFGVNVTRTTSVQPLAEPPRRSPYRYRGFPFDNMCNLHT
jgi:hypothetical protein